MIADVISCVRYVCRFGAVGEEFKAQFIERLGDPSCTLLNSDYDTFINLSTAEDTKHYPALLKKCVDLLIIYIGLAYMMKKYSELYLATCPLIIKLNSNKF